MSYIYCRSAFFFLTMRPPPISTLFPYTTLFRSPVQRAERSRPVRALRVRRPGKARQFALVRRVPPRQGGRADRKSTRLNSSHVSISYAVFCLKKKKKKFELNNTVFSTHITRCPI